MKRMLPIMLALALEGAEPDAAQLDRMAARFARAELKLDTAALSALSLGDQRALAKLIEAARVIDSIYLDQLWSGNHALLAKLRADASPLGKAKLRYFWLNKGPWSELDEHAAFLADVPPKKLPGANFYPFDLTKAEFETWAAKLPEAQRRGLLGFSRSSRAMATGISPLSLTARLTPRTSRVAPLCFGKPLRSRRIPRSRNS